MNCSIKNCSEKAKRVGMLRLCLCYGHARQLHVKLHMQIEIETHLVERRDSRMFVMRNNGLAIREMDGSPSSMIRMSHEEAFLIGFKKLMEMRSIA